MSVADPTSAATRIQSSLQTVERRFDGRISAIEEDIARACEAYRHRDSRDRSQMQVEENTRKLPSSPAVKIFKRAVRGVRKESTTRLASLTSNPAHNKTIYKKEVEYQYLHIVHGDQGPRPND
ncbi:hypothetical protein FRC17_008548 [Serendipita sp. 399]|nr:hypothetical protein FRC17_008548 [Serendipita sp. 399]